MNGRSRLSSTLLSDEGAEISNQDDFDENGYLKDAKRQLLRFSAMSAPEFKPSLEVMNELTLMCWLGGPVVQTTITINPLFPDLYKWIHDRSAPFKTASDQEVDRFHEAVIELMIVISHQSSKMVMDRCLLFLLMNNTANQFWLLKIPQIQESITAVAGEDWTRYPSNYADDLLNLLDLAQNTIKSGSGHESLASLFERIVRH